MRMQALMEHLSPVMHLDASKASRAALLSKCDLLTGMVGEFPELQGLMGYYYALHDGEDKEVACALNEQYMPRFAHDAIPVSDLGTALSLADRMDILVGIFAIGQKPSGVKDPFKLRRHAHAIVRMLIANPAPLQLSTLIAEACENYGAQLSVDKSALQELKPFILERLQSYYQNQGIGYELVLAVRARQDECLYDLDQRIAALAQFVTVPEALSLSAACKRVRNILNQAGIVNADSAVNESLLEEGPERALYQSIQSVNDVIAPLYASGDYSSLLKHLASLKQPVDAYFDGVMVMVDDTQLKNNRVTLLAQLQNLLQGVADISLL
jgi:glycyl-tRNA synthetase beta chain